EVPFAAAVAPAAGPAARRAQRAAALAAKSAAPAAPPRDRESLASPRARRVAKELGIDWRSLSGSGVNGRVRERDVRAAGATPRPASSLSPRRRAIAERLRASSRQTVPVTLTTTADCTNLVALREQFKAARAEHVPTYTDFIACLVAGVLKRHPQLAVRWEQGDALVGVGEDAFDIGIAVDAPQGLIVPVVRDVLHKSLLRVTQESRTLVDKARAGRLASPELHGAVITLSNLGALGIDAFTPVINYPEIAILGLGAVRRVPVIGLDERIVAREKMVLSLTFDHAAIDGAPAARFLGDVAAAIDHAAAHLLQS
ncbi:MAG: 2-oxo acid dehydrogenase subunit E2, partial [Pirellulales bacterium]|nr:2-oxo acid dehydrogenase subunit E2 [Pirellulales bacterium]